MSKESLTEINRPIITDYARLLFTERNPRAAWDLYVRDEYIQHNPNIADGPQAALDHLVPRFSEPGVTYDIQRIVTDGDIAVVHIRVTQPGRATRVNFDMYRLADGYVVEHWDAIQDVPAGAVNPHPMF